MGFASFLLRFLAYALVLGGAYQVAQVFWTRNGLDLVEALAGVHALALMVLLVAPLALAVLGAFARPLAIFVLFYLVGAMITAPFALSMAAG